MEALIKDAGANKNQETTFIDIQLIITNPDQPRKDFEPAALQELANSIKEKGILQSPEGFNENDESLSGAVHDTCVTGWKAAEKFLCFAQKIFGNSS